MGPICSFSLVNSSFTLKKRVNCSKKHGVGGGGGKVSGSAPPPLHHPLGLLPAKMLHVKMSACEWGKYCTFICKIIKLGQFLKIRHSGANFQWCKFFSQKCGALAHKWRGVSVSVSQSISLQFFENRKMA